MISLLEDKQTFKCGVIWCGLNLYIFLSQNTSYLFVLYLNFMIFGVYLFKLSFVRILAKFEWIWMQNEEVITWHGQRHGLGGCVRECVDLYLPKYKSVWAEISGVIMVWCHG